MLKTIACTMSVCALVLLYCDCAGKPGTGGVATTLGPSQTSAQMPAGAAGELKYKAPAGWVTEQPTSSMRVAQYKLPKVEGDSEDAGLVLYFFGKGQGGSVA